MGQHKSNPVAILAKEGKLPPKKPKTGKCEQKRIISRKVQQIVQKLFETAVKKSSAS